VDELAKEDPDLAKLLSARLGDILPLLDKQARIEEELSEATAHFEQARHDEETPENIRENFDIIYHWLVELAELRQLVKGRCEVCGEKLVAICVNPDCFNRGEHVRAVDTSKLC